MRGVYSQGFAQSITRLGCVADLPALVKKRDNICMAFKMSKSSLFAILLRSPWWYSVLFGFAVIGISLLIAGGQFVILGIFGSMPFFGIAGFAAYKESLKPSQARMLEVVEQARKMPAIQIAHKIAETYVQERFDSTAFKGNAAELELERGNRKYLLSTKRFKAANTGVEPLKQLVAAGEKAEATGYLYLALGEISDAAREFASQNDIELIQADRLTEFFDGKADIG